MRAFVAGREVVIGKPAFVASFCGDFAPRVVEAGQIVVYAAIDGTLAGSVTLADTLRGDSFSALKELRPLGIAHTVVVSGDSAATTEHIASQLGISVSHGDCLPGDKVRIVQGLQPRPVMMVGDGVNDAPVLAASDVGVALGAKGSTAASESADVVILVDSLHSVPRALDIGQRTIAIALQSIWLGIVISVGLMILAAAGYIPAIVGALLQELVDLVSILGALRAVREGKPSRSVAPARMTTP
jgi:P-type E1-E2 ATPase